MMYIARGSCLGLILPSLSRFATTLRIWNWISHPNYQTRKSSDTRLSLSFFEFYFIFYFFFIPYATLHQKWHPSVWINPHHLCYYIFCFFFYFNLKIYSSLREINFTFNHLVFSFLLSDGASIVSKISINRRHQYTLAQQERERERRGNDSQ